MHRSKRRKKSNYRKTRAKKVKVVLPGSIMNSYHKSDGKHRPDPPFFKVVIDFKSTTTAYTELF